jgi:L-malate glycosyltransferase
LGFGKVAKIRIAFIIDELNLGGTEIQLISIIQRLRRDKFEPYLICLRDSKLLGASDLQCEKIVLGINKLFSSRGLRRLVWLARFLKRERIEILQTFLIDACILGIVAGSLGGVPAIVSSRRDLGFWYTPKLLFVFRILSRWVDYYMVNSQTVKQSVSRNEGVTPCKISVIYNGIDIQRFNRPEESEILKTREKAAISQEDFVIGIVANLNRQVKRVDIFLKAAHEIHKAHGNTIFMIIGDGCLKKELINLSSALGIDRRTVFLGFQKDLTEYLPLFDIGVLTSDSEGFSNAILEYMAAGIPVVATDCGGNSELLDNGLTGILVPPGDHEGIAEGICSLLCHRERRISMGEEARRVVREKYAWDVKIEELEEYYLSMVKN